MSYILFTDLHLGLYKERQDYLDISIKLIQTICDECTKNNIKNIIFLGDFFHYRKNIGIKTLDYAYKILELLEKNNLMLYCIIGNHDILYNNSLYPTSLQIFSDSRNVKLIDDLYRLDDNLLVPWNYDIESIKDRNYNLMGHFSINGYSVNSEYVYEESEVETVEFNKFKHVYSGHFHTPSSKDNITYIGAPFQHNFGDSHDKRGYYILNDKLHFCEFNAPKYLKIYYSELKEKKKLISNNYIKLIFDKNLDSITLSKTIESIANLGPITLNVEYNFDIQNDGLDDVNVQSINNEDLIYDFIDKCEHPKHINNKMLKNIIKSLLIEDNNV